jgi:iron complex outermembrane receptor protein
MVQTDYKGWSASIVAQLTGKRYTEASNSDVYALPAFGLIDLSVGKQLDFARHHFDFLVSIKNLLNTEYQLYSSRAMPGRNVEIRVTYQLNPKTQSHDQNN